MGVPQKRERVFFIALRKDLANPFLEQKDMFTLMPKIEMNFNEPKIFFGLIKQIGFKGEDVEMTEHKLNVWNRRQPGDLDFSCTLGRTENRPNSMFNNNYIYDHKVVNTITSKKNDVLFSEPRHLSFKENCNVGTYPLDYNFLNMPYRYLIGMSVPPVMTAQIASNIYDQWLSKI